MAKRPAAYYRDYRRRKKAAAEVAAAFAPVEMQTKVSTPEICDWIECNLVVPTGPLSGHPFRLDSWQRDWLYDATKPGIREAGMSIARKNGKSGLIAAWLLAQLNMNVGPRGWRCAVASMTGLLARELRDAVMATAAASALADLKLYKSPVPGRIVGKRGSQVDFLAADRSTGHAIGCDLVVIDEAGLLPETKRPLWNALMSSISGRDGSLWCISIQGDGPMFAEMEQRAAAPNVHWRRWSADEDADLDDEAAWLAGNPALASGVKSRSYMADQAARAKQAAGNESHFRAYDLNQAVDPGRETIVGVAEYHRCVRRAVPQLSDDIVVGIDLGGSSSMTAAVALAVETGAVIVRGAFPDTPSLAARASADRMGTLYDRMRRDGELRTYPGRVTPVGPFLEAFFEEVGALGRIVAVGADRHRKAEAQMAFQAAGLPQFSVFWRGQGASATAHGSHDVRAFQRLVRSGRLATSGSVMLEAAIANSVIRYDGAGNPALDKAANHARIDALSAAVIAAGLAELQADAPLLKVAVV